jgi:hypothetical protein
MRLKGKVLTRAMGLRNEPWGRIFKGFDLWKS